jgi:hypothetical protein
MNTEEAWEEIESFRSLFWLLRDERGVYARWQELVRVHAVKGKAGLMTPELLHPCCVTELRICSRLMTGTSCGIR